MPFLLAASLSTIEVGVIAGFACSLASIVFFTTSVARGPAERGKCPKARRRLATARPDLRKRRGGRVALALHRASAVLTERQAALAESEAIYRTVARNFPDGVVGLFDHDLRFTLMEGKGLEPIGFTKERLEGRTITEVGEELFPETVRAAEAQYRAALRGEKSTTERLVNGHTFLVQIVPVRSDTGEVVAGCWSASTSPSERTPRRSSGGQKRSWTRWWRIPTWSSSSPPRTCGSSGSIGRGRSPRLFGERPARKERLRFLPARGGRVLHVEGP